MVKTYLSRITYERMVIGLIMTIALSVLAYATWLAIRYSGQLILDEYAFRQTQTALTSFWMCHTGFKLAYETPVGGYPWSIPFEFPFYQYLVAKLSCIFNFDLQQVGRLTSYLFFVACLVPAANILKRLFPNNWSVYFGTFTVLLISSPLYLYYSRTFMIETTALFFMLCFLYYTILLLHNDLRWRIVLLIALFFLLALLQKSTTVLPLFIVIALVFTIHVFKHKKLYFKPVPLLKMTIAFVIPFALGYCWAYYTDMIKLHNDFGWYLTSKQLSGWNFGTLEMRFSKSFWVDIVWQRILVYTVSRYLGCISIVFGLIFLNNHLRRLILLSLFAFVIYFLIFENLHYVHKYYQVSNSLFLIFAVALSISGIILKFPKGSLLLVGLLLLIVLGNLHSYWNSFYITEKAQFDNTNRTLAVSELLKSTTPIDASILVYGYDWSSEVSFFSERKSFTVPQWFKPYIGPIKDPLHYLPSKPAAIVVCGDEIAPELMPKIRKFFKSYAEKHVQDCNIYLAKG